MKISFELRRVEEEERREQNSPIDFSPPSDEFPTDEKNREFGSADETLEEREEGVGVT